MHWLALLLEIAAYTNAGYSDTLNISPYKVVYGWEYALLEIYRTASTRVLGSHVYYNRHLEVRNASYQALKLARI
jgi:hypothetical protein